MGQIPSEERVLKARRIGEGSTAPFAPASIEEVVSAIRTDRPAVVFAPHVETASGMLLTDDYLRAVGAAVHEVGGLFVLDCIASGALWVDMRACEVDVLVSAPQKGWSSSPCGALIALSERARQRIDSTTSTSFACDLKRWLGIMETYEGGGYAYHTTLPTDALLRLRDTMRETIDSGLEVLRQAQWTQGRRIRELLQARGFSSVAAEGWQSPGVVVSYTTDPDIKSSKAFANLGLQTAAGVPLQCDEGADFSTFRLGLFGLDKLRNVDRTVQTVAHALEKLKM
jgi:aspartate aminotransferase-like enzyme